MSASHESDVFAANTSGGRRERPFLLPWNRRLRHLEGISVRNLNVVPPIRSRGKTITDDNVPSALRSPVRMLAQSDARPLQHSHSFSHLISKSRSELSPPETATTSYGEISSPKERPRLGKLRRRSTLQWSASSPGLRQKKLEDVAGERLVDSWFSIHCEGIQEPILISEEIHRAMNPTFRAFDLNSLGPDICRHDQLVIKLWAKPSDGNDYFLLVDLNLSLRSLQFLGKNLDNFHHPLPTNCILFHMADGIYTSLTDLPAMEHPINFFEKRFAKNSLSTVETTSSFDGLMQLANLDECIQDALATRASIEAQINALIHVHQVELKSSRTVAQAEEALYQSLRACAAQRKQNRNDLKYRDHLRLSLEKRRMAMKAAREEQDNSFDSSRTAVLRNESGRQTAAHMDERSTGQVRRICEDLLRIFPIEPLPEKPLQFTIRGLPLPNSKFEDIDNRESVAAALGFTAHLVNLLSQYISVVLPYPIQHLASNSLIEDPISVALPQRVFPLYPINVTYRFEYGVFLLNKDIEFLMDRHNLRMLDIRHTLPNLKYLLYVLTAGTGELPARHIGGIKGLITGTMSPTWSRRSSEDSVANGTANSQHRAVESGGLPLMPRSSEKAVSAITSPLHGSPNRGTTFRTGALRQGS